MSFKEGFLKSGGYKIHYVLWGGSGPKLVFIHSMGMDGHSMNQLAESLHGEYQVLSLTILDHGDSDTPEESVPLPDHAEIMRDCYRQMGFFPNTLIGHSVGGMMGMVLTAEHPQEHKGLVLVDIAPFELTGRTARPPPPESFKDEAEARKWLKERYPGFTPEYVKNRLKYAFKEEEGVLKLKPRGDVIRAGLRTDLWPYVERMTTPCLLLIGGGDSIVTPETVERMKTSVPDLEAVTVEGATHMIPQDKPQEFEKHVRAFLKKLY